MATWSADERATRCGGCRHGTITTIAGTNLRGLRRRRPGDGRPAEHAAGLAVLPDGGLLIADANNHRIRRVSPNGTITTVAGNGRRASPATAARRPRPSSTSRSASRSTRDGGFLIADFATTGSGGSPPSGTITTVAGTGVKGFSGDGGPATARPSSTPVRRRGHSRRRVPDRRLRYNRVRRVSPTGTITTVAGTGGSPGRFCGDGGPATVAQLDSTPTGVATTPDGGCLISRLPATPHPARVTHRNDHHRRRHRHAGLHHQRGRRPGDRRQYRYAVRRGIDPQRRLRVL